MPGFFTALLADCYMAQTAQIFSSGNAQTIKAALKDFASTRLNLGPPTKPAAAQFFVRIKN
jgi:hypothetical protein